MDDRSVVCVGGFRALVDDFTIRLMTTCVPKTSSKTPELAGLRWITLACTGEG
jgi:hypothetical protein